MENYTHTSLIDGFYVKLDQINRYRSYTNTEYNLNFDHFPIHLCILDNYFLSKPSIIPLVN